MLTLKMKYLRKCDFENLVGLTALVVFIVWGFSSQDQVSGTSLGQCSSSQGWGALAPGLGREKEEAAVKEDEEDVGFEGWWREQLERKLRVTLWDGQEQL